MMPKALVTGANRGIGLALTEALLDRGWTVAATCRQPAQASELAALARRFDGRLDIEALAVEDFAAIGALAQRMEGVAIDALINNAGVTHRDTRLGTLDFEAWRKVLEINLMAPMRMAEAFLEHVAASDQKKIVSISSSLGSIASTTGANYFYRTSKAALNMAMRSAAMDLAPRGVIVAMLSPGYVDTDFTRGVSGPPKISARDSGAGLADAIAALTLEDAGVFKRFNGQPIPW